MIYLLGFMGAGKSSVARALARELGWEWVDLDQEIERAEGRSIADIFRTQGEEAFRRMEARALKKVARRRRVVVACGGGTPLRRANLDLIRRTGTSVWLDAPLEVMLRRCAGAGERPLMADRPAMKALLDARRPVYSQADLRVDAAGGSPREVARRIAERLAESGDG